MRIAFILLSILTGQAYCQKMSTGYWQGSMERDGSFMSISIEIIAIQKGISAVFNAPSQKASGIPLDSIVLIDDAIRFQLMSEPVTYYDCKISGDKMIGYFTQYGFSTGKLSLVRSQKPKTTFIWTDTSFTSGEHKLGCRIYFPKQTGKFPAVVFLHGSGGEAMFANQYLAEYLASQGIVTLIQDKRGVGRSSGNWTSATFEDLANDYIAAIKFLKKFAKVNKNQVGVYGHSQGGTLSPLLASKSKDVSFIIAAAAIGDTVYKQDLYRVERNLESNDFSEAEVTEAMKHYRQWLDMARTGIGFEKLDALVQTAKDKRWHEWVEAPPRQHWIWQYYLGIGNFNSLDYWSSVDKPVLLVYGEKDQIEDVGAYLNNIDQVLRHSQKTKDITELILPNAQHNLCIFPNNKDKFFWWYLSRGYEDLITAWIKLRFKN